MKRHQFLTTPLAVLVLSVMWSTHRLEADGPAKPDQPEPVDDSMHHLMEYVFAPAYKRLKANMASEPATRKEWKPIKADSLTLAEACNLLLHRIPEEDAARWLELSVGTREAGGVLYQAARAGDSAKAVEAYRLMLQRCNACHDDFADGEYQLKP